MSTLTITALSTFGTGQVFFENGQAEPGISSAFQVYNVKDNGVPVSGVDPFAPQSGATATGNIHFILIVLLIIIHVI